MRAERQIAPFDMIRAAIGTTFVKQIQTGEVRTNRGEHYSKQTISVWKQFRRVFLDFYSKHPFTWEQIDQNLINRFRTYLEGCDYMKKTIDKYMRLFKQVISDAEKLGYHSNHIGKNLIKRLSIKESDKTKEIYLTKDELEAMFEMELSGTEELVRDMFLIGCYTGQRFSDFSNINETCIGVTSKGVRVIRVEQQKTNTPVVVPILNDNLLRIAERYDFEIPTVSDVILNRYIKLILKRLSESVPSLGETEVTKLTMKEREKEARGEAEFMRNEYGDVIKCRYDLVTSHTARRSGITNLYLTGLFDTVQMMSISGHKDQRTFFDYIKLSSDEIADRIMDKLRQSEQASNETLF